MEVTTTVLSRCRVKSSPKSACRPATQTHCPVAKYCQHRARPPCFSAFQWLSWFLLTQLPLPTLAHFYSFLIVPSSHTGQNTTAIHNYTNKAIRKGKGRQVSWLPPRFGGKGEWLMHVICYVFQKQPPQYFQFCVILQNLANSHKDMESISPPLEPRWDSVASSTKRTCESGRLSGRRHDFHQIHMRLLSALSQLSLLEPSHHVKVTWRGHLWMFWLTAPCYQTCERTDLKTILPPSLSTEAPG